MAKKGWRSANLSPDRRIFFGQGRGDVRSRALAARVTASFGSRGGASTADLLFPLLFAPTLISVTPNTGFIAGGTVVDLAGLHFRPGATATFGGIAATIVSVTSTHITATTPAHAAGLVSVTVTNPDSQSSTLAGAFTYAIPPLFVAVGANLVATSPTGVTWTARTIPAGSWTAVVWNGTVFVAVGSNVAATSPDGITWTARTIPAGNYNAVAWNGTVLVATGLSGTAASSPDGITWTARTFPCSNCDERSVAWSGSLFCAVGSNESITSPDGITWTFNLAFPDGPGSSPRGLVWNGSLFVSVGGNNRIFYSNDTVHWVQATSPVLAYQGVAWDGLRFVTVGSTATAATSPTGTVWTQRTIPAGTWVAVANNGTVFAAVGNGVSATSPDGAIWTSHTMPLGSVAAICVGFPP
jgi:hypothetical protein